MILKKDLSDKSKEFAKGYKKTNDDVDVKYYTDAVGFVVIRKYSDKFIKKYGDKLQNKFAYMKVWNDSDDNILYGVEMVEDRDGEYYYVDSESFNFVSFYADKNNNDFILKNDKILLKKNNKEISLNKFVDILMSNHVSRYLSASIRIQRKLYSVSIRVIFWLVNIEYNPFYSREDVSKLNIDKIKKPEPFMKYFYISKHLLFLTVILFLLAVIIIDYTTNGLNIKQLDILSTYISLPLFILLFVSEKLSTFIIEEIKSAFSYNKENFVRKLHNKQFAQKFKLKI